VSDPSDVGYEILRSLRRILRKVSEHSRNLAHTTGLTVPQLLCMRAIKHLRGESEVTVAMVAKRVRLANATVSRILDRLERAGYIQRERLTVDRRKVAVKLTVLGEERLRNLPQPLHDQFLQRLHALDAEERERLLRSLDRVVEMMEAEDIDAAPMLAPDIDVKKAMPGE
jgi:DNA-binding MarR family transcriptional regulator